MRQAQAFQPGGPARFLEHGDRGGTARDDAEIGDHADRGQMAHRPAGFGIEYMAVADTVHDEAALVIAAAGQRALPQQDRPHDGFLVPGVAYADAPWTAVGARADDFDVAAQVNHAVPDAGALAQRRRTVDRILLDDAAEIDLHARHRELKHRRLPAQFVPAHFFQQFLNLCGVRQFAPVEAPGAAQNAGSDVEQAVALLMAGRRVIQQSGRFFVYRNAPARGRHAIDGGQEAVVAVAGIKRFQPVDVGDDRVRSLPGLRLRFGVELDVARRAHGLECAVMELHAVNLSKPLEMRQRSGLKRVAPGGRQRAVARQLVAVDVVIDGLDPLDAEPVAGKAAAGHDGVDAEADVPVAPALAGRVVHRSQRIERLDEFASYRTLNGVHAAHRGREPVQQVVAAPGRGLEDVAEREARIVLVLEAFGAAELRAPGPSVHLPRVSDARLEIPGAAAQLHAVMDKAGLYAVGVPEPDADIAGRRADAQGGMQVMVGGVEKLEHRIQARIADAACLAFVQGVMRDEFALGFVRRRRCAAQSAHGHVHVDELGHEHQVQPVGRRIHEVEHVHVHVHAAGRQKTGIAFAAVADDDRVADFARAVQHVAGLRAVHVTVADHEIAGFAQHVVEHDAGRRMAAVMSMVMVGVLIAAGRGERRQIHLQRRVDHVKVEVRIVAFTAPAQLQ